MGRTFYRVNYQFVCSPVSQNPWAHMLKKKKDLLKINETVKLEMTYPELG